MGTEGLKSLLGGRLWLPPGCGWVVEMIAVGCLQPDRVARADGYKARHLGPMSKVLRVTCRPCFCSACARNAVSSVTVIPDQALGIGPGVTPGLLPIQPSLL